METFPTMVPKAKKVVSFKEVHKELELEAQFLNLNHDIEDFGKKSKFLSSIGFRNSIATRIYKDISEHSETVAKYREKYPYHKFIFKSQMMRICEKYDLYVREPNLFIGDIPTKNINDMRNFKIDPADTESFIFAINDPERNEEIQNKIDEFLTKTFRYSSYIHNNKIPLDRFFNDLDPLIKYSVESRLRGSFINREDAKYDEFELRLANRLNKSIEIAAVKSLFNPSAFDQSDARILDEPELEAKSQVDLDPIVLMKVKGGYLIITAWGDEANDELVVNQTLN